ncbi:hypothetical protein J3R30DRAFT_3479793 [Lentinula aciculospora]|uniref:Uncharacterized protein n=1 Tax=Lentinula aciculospora TaxID=153920 RepID=A0A9W9AB76_9AGAR|nr:hypothetical protein J3R30DRAFT_3479793 [Lentinula aciculospora]
MSLATLETLDGPTEFLKHPDFRTVSAFFLGWVFYASLCSLSSSLHLKESITKLRVLLVSSTTHLATVRSSTDEFYIPSFDLPSPFAGDNVQHILIAMLFFSFVTGSLANFGSLLSFKSGSELCAFLVAWSLLSLETARLMGLFTLLLSLRHLGIMRWELAVSLICSVIGLAFVFVNAALATGVMQTVPQLNTSLCFRRHFLPASVVSTSIYLCLEVFVVVRLWFKFPRQHLRTRRGFAYILNIRTLRALSLMLLDLLTAVPPAIVTNTLGDSIPYSIGAIAVLLVFSHKSDDCPELAIKQESPDISPVSETPAAQEAYSSWVPYHPYSARSLSDPTLLQRWDDGQRVARTTTTRSSRTIDSRTARSIREAVIHQAKIKKLSISDFQVNHGLASSSQSIAELAAPSQTLKPLRPRLVIVARISNTWPVRPIVQVESSDEDESFERRTSTPLSGILKSSFSSPSLATTRSRSTITYPSQVLSFPSAERDPIVLDHASDSRLSENKATNPEPVSNPTSPHLSQ